MWNKLLMGLVAALFSPGGFSQAPDLQSLDIVKIENLDSLSEVTETKEALANARIVLLGEQSHGEGATFDAKVKIIQFLHQQLGFEIVAFESGLYTNFKAGEIDRTTNPSTSAFYESVGDIWSDTKQFKALLEYVKGTESSDTPLKIHGFDFLEGPFFREYYFNDLKEHFLQENISLDNEVIETLEEPFFGDVDYVATNEEDSMKFHSAIKSTREGFSQLKENKHSKILRQAFESYLASIKWAVDMYKEREYWVQNPRDLQMAKNLIFLAELFPNKKIIGWGASFHFANDILQYQNTDLTRQYIREMEDENEGFDLDSSLHRAVPMGQILKKKYGDELYSLAFSSYQGTYGLVGKKGASIPAPPQGSIEAEINALGFDHAFVDFSHKKYRSFYSSALGNLPILAPWQEIFDGLLFINSSYPPEFYEYYDAQVVEKDKFTNYQIAGKVVDSKTRQPIPYAHVTLGSTPKGTVTNSEGYFEFNLDSDDPGENLVISSIGYGNLVLDLTKASTAEDTLYIKMDPKTLVLDEMIISAKSLTAKEIVQKAKKSIENNYFQGPYNQEFFYRVQKQENDSTTFIEEASVFVHDKSGYKPSNSAYRNFSGQILQFRNTTGNPNKDKWSGVGSIWLVFSHDIIFDKDNILHRASAYEMELAGITTYNDEEVYEISFFCKRPSAYTTGYGYPAPKSSHGKLYIKTKDYAILRYEHCIERKNSTPKKRAKYRSENGKISLIQTYKRYNDKYFIQHSKQVMSSDRIDLSSMEGIKYVQSFDLLSTEIYTDTVVALEKPIDKIKVGMKIKEDKDFWKKHNIVYEDGRSVICGLEYNESR